MSNTDRIAENDVPAEEQRPPDEEASWFERLLQSFGLGEEPDLRELIEDALARSRVIRSTRRSAACFAASCISASSWSRT